jgi:tetratricopeptide (TPR) repeat protein
LLFNRMDKPQKAFETLNALMKPLTAQYGKSSAEVGNAYSELAEAQLALGQNKEAEQNAKNAIGIFEQLVKGEGKNERTQDSERDLGLGFSRLARALSKQGFNSDARDYFLRARTALATDPGYKEQDLADELRLEALFFGKVGSNKTATQLFEKSCQIKEALSDPEQPAHLSGEVKFTWEHGSPRSHEIIDHEFPLRYITANHIRVAVTVIDLWELASVLVCVTNLDDHRRPVGLGKVKAFHAVIDTKCGLTKQLAPLTYVDHKIIDRIRRERGMWDLTQDRPWLANIQRTRNIRGLVPPSGHDLFRGPNVFGVWGEWPGVSHTVPTRVSVYPSRENIFNRNEDDDIDTEAGLIRNEGAKHAGLTTIALEPMESRTGETFYIYPRGEDILVQVVVGNTTFEFPFHCRKRRIP